MAVLKVRENKQEFKENLIKKKKKTKKRQTFVDSSQVAGLVARLQTFILEVFVFKG